MKKCDVFGGVILLDHLHLLIYPRGKYTISDFMHFVKRHFSRNVRILQSTNLAGEDGHPRLPKVKFGWQSPFYDHVIRDEKDFATHLDYLKYNPIKHGLVKEGEKYPYLFINYPAIRRFFR